MKPALQTLSIAPRHDSLSALPLQHVTAMALCTLRGQSSTVSQRPSHHTWQAALQQSTCMGLVIMQDMWDMGL